MLQLSNLCLAENMSLLVVDCTHEQKGVARLYSVELYIAVLVICESKRVISISVSRNIFRRFVLDIALWSLRIAHGRTDVLFCFFEKSCLQLLRRSFSSPLTPLFCLSRRRPSVYDRKSRITPILPVVPLHLSSSPSRMLLSGA